jgi:AraC-like DNA-binding protein
VTPAANIDEFLLAPVERYVMGSTWLSFCTREGLAGAVIWGQPAQADAESFVRAVPARGSPLAARRPRYVDVRRLEAPHPAAFQVFVEYVANHRTALEEAVARAAVVHAGGMSSALAAGFPSVATTPFPLELFTDPVAALRFLGHASPEVLASELESLQARASGMTPLVRDLRAFCSAHLTGASLGSAARALGVSERSLQRRLREEGTSFQNELNQARSEMAQHLLAHTDATVAEIAHEVGCASVHHFGALFRKMTGDAPARFRWARRGRSRS